MSARDKLFYALLGTVRELESILLALNAEKMPHDGDEFHERLNAAKRVLAEAEAEKQEPDKLDAERYRLLRRGQHWSVISGIGDTLRGEELDSAIDAAKEAK